MSPTKLTKEEQDILDAFEQGEYESVLTDERTSRLKKL